MATAIMDRAAQMFPQLTPAHLERISSVGYRRDVHVGDQNTRFFVVVSGAIDIVRMIVDRMTPSALRMTPDATVAVLSPAPT